MNARAMMESTAVHEFIFGDSVLHARFSLALEVLARLAIAAPAAVSMSALADMTGHSCRSLKLLLGALERSGLAAPSLEGKDAWCCPPTLDGVTLADVFLSVAALTPDTSAKRKSTEQEERARGGAQQGIDLLVMQATTGINQLVLQHLQAFDLCRLKALVRPGTRSGLPLHHRSYVPEPV